MDEEILKVEETEIKSELNSLKILVMALQNQFNYFNAELTELVNYVREQGEENQKPVGCGFSCTNNSFSVGR